MANIREIINRINGAKIYTPHAVEDIIDMSGIKEMARIDLDEHRWYTIATVVYQAKNGFFGVRGAVSLKSETSGYDDVGHICEAFEMIEVPSVTYSRKA